MYLCIPKKVVKTITFEIKVVQDSLFNDYMLKNDIDLYKKSKIFEQSVLFFINIDIELH